MTRTLKRGDSLVGSSYRLQTNTSYPFSAEASFRQLDDVFLQTQTRIWLGEVLTTRLDEETSVTDLLADGILLFEVSKVMWKMLLTKFMKLGSSKAFFSKSVASGKSVGRYMPYSNVDSFLKICQVLGLTGIDLFSPSDVVEKQDYRRVCLCIRSLSKKARSKDLNVPDFDVVTYTVAMPKDMVKGIRNSLEQSQCRSSVNSAGCSTYLLSIPKYGQRYWAFDNGRHYDSYSEESDSTDSNYQVFGYYSPASTISCGGASLLNSDAESSPRGSTLDVENLYLLQSYQSGDQDEEIDRRSHGSCGLLEAKGSLDALNLLNDSNQFADTLPGGMLSPSGLDCQINARILSGNKEAVKRALNAHLDEKMRASHMDIDLESCSLSARNSMDHKENAIGQSGTSDLSCRSPQSDEYAALNRRENEFAYNLHREATFHEPHSIYKTTTSQLGRVASEEVEDASSASSELCDLDDTNLEIKFEGKHAFINPYIILPQHQKRVEYHTPVDSTANTDKRQIHLNLEEIDPTKPLLTEECQLEIISHGSNGLKASKFDTPHRTSASYTCQSPIRVSRVLDGTNFTYPPLDNVKDSGSDVKGPNTDVREDLRVSTSEGLNATASIVATREEKCSDLDTYVSSVINVDDSVTYLGGGIALFPCIQTQENNPSVTCTGSNVCQEVQSDRHLMVENEVRTGYSACTNHKECIACVAQNMEEVKLEQVGRVVGASDRKPPRKILLKTVAGGMSLVGVFFLLFHIRRTNGREKINETSVPSTQVGKTNNWGTSRKTTEPTGRTGGIYPAENLRF